MMLMLDDVGSPGLLVRPRPGRLELCGEFVAADDLRAAAIFALGSTLACAAEVSHARSRLPSLELRLRYGDQRYGWFVDRRAGGDDLYEFGRECVLQTTEGETRTGGEHLRDAWARARAYVAPHAAAEEIALVAEMVDGQRPLRIDRLDAPGKVVRAAFNPTANVAGSAYGRALAPVQRPGFDLAPVMLTWQLALFVVARADDPRRAFVAVPGRLLGRFLKRLGEGRLDDLIDAYMQLPPTGRVPRRSRHVEHAGLFDGLAMRPALLAPEHPLPAPGAVA
jgi:hypothetical protein